MNLAIVGGSGSSGTTLLARLLSRHPCVVSGPEMKFFNLGLGFRVLPLPRG